MSLSILLFFISTITIIFSSSVILRTIALTGLFYVLIIDTEIFIPDIEEEEDK